jgi:hypothetical protein
MMKWTWLLIRDPGEKVNQFSQDVGWISECRLKRVFLL